MVQDIPEELNTGEPSVKPRWASIIIAAASLSGSAWLTFEVLTARIKLRV